MFLFLFNFTLDSQECQSMDLVSVAIGMFVVYIDTMLYTL